MKIKEIRLRKFKRFTDLTIKNIPESAKLIVLVGPNGSGKTSIFEGINQWQTWNTSNNRVTFNSDYIVKQDTTKDSKVTRNDDRVMVDFYGEGQNDRKSFAKGKFYFRTAYRHEPDFNTLQLNKQNNPTEAYKFPTLLQDDKTVSENYQRLVAQTISSLYDDDNNSKSVQELREELVGKIKDSVSSVFEDLSLASIGDPLVDGGFYFTKGTSNDFHYKNLSAGEKSVFDLILDLIIKAGYYEDAIYCIDEPEAHMHTRLQSKVLNELYSLTPDNSQLWIATHSKECLEKQRKLKAKVLEQLFFWTSKIVILTKWKFYNQYKLIEQFGIVFLTLR